MSIRTHPAPVAEVAAELRTGERDPVAYVDDLCDRIAAIDDDLGAFVPEPDRRGRLREAAAALPERFPDPADRPPLYGIPVGVKDIVHVDGFVTRAGSALPPALFAGGEASCVERLREAGALVAGKTVTTEFAGAAPGLTRNPHDLDHTPGGSSSGSAAGVAAGLVPLALGTQTGGSVIRPAAFCGVVGVKPSFERIPRAGVIERSGSLDHVGFFTQDVAGARVAASVLCDDWAADDPAPDGPPAVGVPEGSYLDNASPEALSAYEAGLDRLADAGCRVERVTVPTFEAFEALDRRHRRLHAAELALVHHGTFDDYRAFYRTPMAERIEDGRAVTAGQLAESRASRLALRAELEALLDGHDLDVWAAPAAPGAAPETIRSTGDPVMNRPWTHAGLPVVTLPAERAANGLPLGVQFAAPFGADERLLAWAVTLADAL
ncbi:MAG: amidase [Haloferacaceae archaeon]